MSALRIELRRSPMLWAFPLLVFVATLATWRELLPGVAVWDTTTTALLTSVQLTGPLAAGLAAWAAGRERRRRLDYVRLLGVRSPATPPLVQLAALVIWAIASFLVVVVAASVVTARDHGYGSLALGGVLAAALGLTVHVVVGFGIGRAWPRFVVAPLVAFATYWYIVLNLDHGGEPFYLLAPVTVEEADAFNVWQRGIFAHQVVWYALLVATVVLLMIVIAKPGRLAIVALVISVALAGVAAYRLLGYQGYFFDRQPRTFSYVCAQQSIRVCVHPAYARGRTELLKQLSPIAERLRGTPGEFSTAEHLPRGDRPAHPGTAVIYMDDLGPGFAMEAAEELGVSLRDANSCGSMAENPTGMLVYEVVTSWLVGNMEQVKWVMPEEQQAAQALTKMSEPQRRAWLRANYARYTTCRLAPADIKP